MSDNEDISIDSQQSDIDYDYYEPEDFGQERAILERVGGEIDDPKTFEGAVRIANRNLDAYITVSPNIAKNVIVTAQKHIPNYETKNPTACILSYMCIKNGKIEKKVFDEIVKIITKNKELNIRLEDLIRYCRMWLKNTLKNNKYPKIKMENNVTFLFLIILFSSLVATFRWIYKKKFLQILSPINLLFITSCIFAFLVIISFVVLGKGTLIEQSKKLSWYWIPLIILSVLGVFVGLFINKVLTKHDLSIFVPTRYVVIQILVILASVLILKETPNKLTWVAFAFFIIGSIIMVFSQYKKNVT